MNFALIAVVLAIVWGAITANFLPSNLLLGAVVAFLVLWFIRERVAGPHLFRRAWRFTKLGLLFFYELLLSAVRVALLVMTPNVKAHMQPAIVAFPLKAKTDVQITLLANLITLTPGTLSVDVSEDRRFIYVHAISAPDVEGLIESIASGFEAKIMEAFE